MSADEKFATHAGTGLTPLREYTSARLSLGRMGAAVSTREQLRFQLDHALARDAVHAALDVAAISLGLRERGLEAFVLRSAADVQNGSSNRGVYLRRPDLGRRLHADFRQALLDRAKAASTKPDVVFVIADGLSALAVERHALPLLEEVLRRIDREHVVVGPVCVVTQARVAIGDEIGQLLGAKMVVLLIGERPGLSSPDSLGVYLTWEPKVGRSDAERNCVSNVRDEGLGYAEAAERILGLMVGARALGASGVGLKDGAVVPERLG